MARFVLWNRKCFYVLNWMLFFLTEIGDMYSQLRLIQSPLISRFRLVRHYPLDTFHWQLILIAPPKWPLWIHRKNSAYFLTGLTVMVVKVNLAISPPIIF